MQKPPGNISVSIVVFKLVVQVGDMLLLRFRPSKEKEMKWLDTLGSGLLGMVVRRVMPALLGGIVGVLLDAGLLDGQLGQAVLRSLNL